MDTDSSAIRYSRFYLDSQHDILAAVETGKADRQHLCYNVQTSICLLNSNYTVGSWLPTEEYYEDTKEWINNTWWEACLFAKAFDDEVSQWHLVAAVAGAKAIGSVQIFPANSLDGSLWQDLPFFRSHLREAWAKPQDIESSAWCNINAFAARLTAVNACDLLDFGLATFRVALETPVSQKEGEKPQTELEKVRPLLLAVRPWITHASWPMSHRIDDTMKASSDRFLRNDDKNSELTSFGALAQEAGVEGDVQWSLSRLDFWIQRLRAMIEAHEAEKGKRESEADDAVSVATWLSECLESYVKHRL